MIIPVTHLRKQHSRLPLRPLARLTFPQLRFARRNHVTCKTFPTLRHSRINIEQEKWNISHKVHLILRTVLCNRWILIRRGDLIQLMMNMRQVRIVSVSRHHRLLLELLRVPIVIRHDVVTVIFLWHVLLLELVLMDRRVAIHDSELLILAENVTDAERGSGDRGRQHSNAFSRNVSDFLRNLRTM